MQSGGLAYRNDFLVLHGIIRIFLLLEPEGRDCPPSPASGNDTYICLQMHDPVLFALACCETTAYDIYLKCHLIVCSIFKFIICAFQTVSFFHTIFSWWICGIFIHIRVQNIPFCANFHFCPCVLLQISAESVCLADSDSHAVTGGFLCQERTGCRIVVAASLPIFEHFQGVIFFPAGIRVKTSFADIIVFLQISKKFFQFLSGAVICAGLLLYDPGGFVFQCCARRRSAGWLQNLSSFIRMSGGHASRCIILYFVELPQQLTIFIFWNCW